MVSFRVHLLGFSVQVSGFRRDGLGCTPTSLTKKMVPVREDPCIFLFHEEFAEKRVSFLISIFLFLEDCSQTRVILIRMFLRVLVYKCVHV